jgi:hypothetical protein
MKASYKMHQLNIFRTNIDAKSMSKTMAYKRKIIFSLACILNNVFIASHSTWIQEKSNVIVPDHRGKRVAPFLTCKFTL